MSLAAEVVYRVLYALPDSKVTVSIDFFLTTVKPLNKTVRAEDVQSCIYYVHVDSDRDEELLHEEKERREQLRTGSIQPRMDESIDVPAFSGRPLQQQLGLTREDRPKPPLKIHSHPQSQTDSRNRQQVSRKPVPQPGGDQVTTQSRHLLGARLMQERFGGSNGTALQILPHRQNIDVRRWSAQPAYTPKCDPYKEKQAELDEIYAVNAAPLIKYPNSTEGTDAGTMPSSGTNSVCDEDSAQQVEPSLTLIRRYGDAQSNVSRIRPSEGTIEILSPGYSRYESHDPANKGSGGADSQSQKCNAPPFFRNLQATGRPMRPRQSRGSDSVGSSLGTERPSFNTHSRSQTSSDRLAYSTGTGEANRTNRYVFNSPWNSVCEFTTGVAGRSLKCRIIDSASSTATPLSELRFNLPSSQALRSPPKTAHPGTPRESKRSSFFAKSHHRTSSSLSQETSQPHTSVHVPDNYDEDCLDLSLGQEHAGGGFGGKQAKLGKLILEPEGLHMLDLLVAANIIMWWKVYDQFA